MDLLRGIAYFAEHESLLWGLLDEMVAGIRLADESPAATFASLVAGLDSQREKTVTVAALALMRLSERSGGEPS